MKKIILEDLKIAIEKLEKAIQDFKESLDEYSEDPKAIEALSKIRIDDIPDIQRKQSLHDGGVHTMADVYKIEKGYITRYRNIGKKTVEALDEWFRLHGIVWK